MNLGPNDYSEITNLYAKYNLASDRGDSEAFADCFTAGGTLSADEDIFVTGRDDLVKYKEAEVENRQGRYRRHANSSLHLTPKSSDEVHGACYLQAFNGDPGQLPVLAVTGVYADIIVREEGVWRFLSRRLTRD